MSLFAYIPAIMIGVIFLGVVFISAWIERAARQRVSRRPRPIFRPVVIEGGKGQPVDASETRRVG
jgi:hypothetical protein